MDNLGFRGALQQCERLTLRLDRHQRGLSAEQEIIRDDSKAARLRPFTWLERAFSSHDRLVGLLAWVWFCVRLVRTLLGKPLAQEKRL